MDERHLEAMDVQVSQTGARKDAGGAVVIGMDVGDDQAAQAARSEVFERLADRGEGLFRVHAAIEEVGVLAVREEEDVDEAILERDREAELEDARRDLAQCELNGHLGILAEPSKMSSGPYSNVLKMSPLLAWRSRCPKSR